MNLNQLRFSAVAALFLGLGALRIGAVTVQEIPGGTAVAGERYRLRFVPEGTDLGIDVRAQDGKWHTLSEAGSVSYTWSAHGQSHELRGARATWAISNAVDYVVVSQQAVLDRASGAVLELHYICRNEGVLLGVKLSAPKEAAAGSVLWAPPRLALSPATWDGYLFWDPDGAAHSGKLDRFTPTPAYAGVSAWEQNGDVTPRLSASRPALAVRSSGMGLTMGVVFLDYTNRWAGVRSFIQRHSAKDLYFYPGYAAADDPDIRWAWLAPLPSGEDAAAEQVRKLARNGEALVRSFQPMARPVPESWLQPPPDFPAHVRRTVPVTNIADAVVFTMGETTASNYALDLARRAGSDFIIRGWFKWGQAPPVDRWNEYPKRAHQQGALFGGGITCSALYDSENGITRAQLLDMATRGPDGALIDAWGQPGIRHGSLSSPAYLDFLFRWCREQIDAGADYLFMDEHTAVLSAMEGFDDHSLNDFRRWLLNDCAATRGWDAKDARWGSQYKVDLGNPAVCPDGGMGSFNYRAYLKAENQLANPAAAGNPMAALWHSSRTWRDDRAWRALTDRIRAHARQQGRQVLISANGLARYVDLQVLGVWDQWLVKDGQIDLSQNLLPYWHGLVTQGRELAAQDGASPGESRMPVVLFHDWGMGDVPFPWLAVPPSQRELWLRTRAAEIYAAGAFFAFPVLGPFGCDAGRDGTLPEITRQAAFYQAHRDLYLRGRFLGSESLRTESTHLSLAAWSTGTPTTVLVHVINRDVRQGKLQVRRDIGIEVPLNGMPTQASAVSPDWQGTRPVRCVQSGNSLRVTVPELEAYSVISLRFDSPVDLARLKDSPRVQLASRWERPTRNEYRVRADGSIEHAYDLNGLLQGRLHSHMRNPPTFVVNAESPMTLSAEVRAVATQGARLECRIDGRLVSAVELPDLDGKNDSSASEYDRILRIPIPAGNHRVTLDNDGADWMVLRWLEFTRKTTPEP